MIRRYKEGMDRQEEARLPPRLDDYVGADNPVRAIDAYVDTLDLRALGFDRTAPNRTEAGPPPFPPSALLKPACTATSTGCAAAVPWRKTASVTWRRSGW